MAAAVSLAACVRELSTSGEGRSALCIRATKGLRSSRRSAGSAFQTLREHHVPKVGGPQRWPRAHVTRRLCSEARRPKQRGGLQVGVAQQENATLRSVDCAEARLNERRVCV
eukprot:3438613-Prymnesium_polylepis.2